jgi:DNA-binding NarL/FixJ family response regulator
MIKVLIADDHAIVRAGIRQLAVSQTDMEIVGEAEDGTEALEKARSLCPDVVVLDIAMPRLNGLEGLRLIKQAVPDTQIVIFSMHGKENYVHQALSSGAFGYVLKASPSSEVFEAIRAAYQKKYFLSPRVAGEVIVSYLKYRDRPLPVQGYELLSEREKQVFHLVVEGNSTRQMADLLCLSPKTVEKHRSNLMKKLGITDSLEMIKYAVKTGLADPELWEE